MQKSFRSCLGLQNLDTDRQSVSYQEILLETSDNDNKEKRCLQTDGNYPEDQNFCHSAMVKKHEDIIPSIKYKHKFNKNKPFLNICKKDEYSDISKPFINELKLIPRNKISAFKAFRNCTFKLVPISSNQTLMNNSNNSNRFSVAKPKCFNGFNSAVNSNEAYINKINRKIMLKKITELANPYNDNSNKPFKRIIPHPIIDDKNYRDLFQISLSSETNDDVSENLNIFNGENDKIGFVSDNGIMNKNSKLLTSHMIFENSIDIDNYENILINKLKEIRDLKTQATLWNKDISCPKDKFANIHPCHMNEMINHKMGIGKIENNQISDSYKRTPTSLSFHFNNLNKNNCFDESTVKCQSFSNLKLENKETKEEILNKSINNLISFKKNHFQSKRKPLTDFSSENIKLSNSQWKNVSMTDEVEVCFDKHNLSKNFENNLHIPLYFKCVKGKKIKFKIRYQSKIMKAQKAFCSRMSINSLSYIKFTTEAGQIITDTDSPYSLNLKPNDVIIVSVSPCFKPNIGN